MRKYKNSRKKGDKKINLQWKNQDFWGDWLKCTRRDSFVQDKNAKKTNSSRKKVAFGRNKSR